MASKAIAIVAGVGPGTGAAVARRFAAAYPVALLARNPENYESLVQEINKNGGKAIGISTDVSSQESVKNAFGKIEQEFNGAPIAAAVFNASGRFVRKPLLDMTVEDLQVGWEVSVRGAFIFSQATLPGLLKYAEDGHAKYPPTLIFTGATASIKANAQMSSFASAKFAMRALSTSIAKEFAPQGVHVAHAIIDGVIDIPRTKEWLKDMPPEAKIGADDIAETYWNLHTQSKRCFTNEVDIRPMLEKW
ncbi:putative oxidoreductase, short chain dehydrogenase/reductase family [Teratosphaeria destructans]|uniref:Oxidoreductase, short chain dehydrogenase/reductase family n=1 Tax=Teratosphaeria destructans TaxID=418781 RepID=A0A9W7VZ67_9PEZI|nr:putative oxidoreductase, short chain dehydrogenase/reductase family [Teratosphaeria destructans]